MCGRLPPCRIQSKVETRNKSIISKAMQYRQDVSGVNYNVNSNYTKYLAQLCGRFYILEKFPPQICEFCGAIYRYNYETFSDF